MTKYEPIDDTIRTVAARGLGIVDVSIVRHVDHDWDPKIGGVWFVLAIRLPGDDAWKLLGRRRTKVELLTLVSDLDPRHVEGKHFRNG